MQPFKLAGGSEWQAPLTTLLLHFCCVQSGHPGSEQKRVVETR